MKDKRIGRFFISTRTIEDSPELVRQIMGRCIVVRCEMMFVKNGFEYEAISSDFDEVEEGGFVPEYKVIFSGKTIEFKRRGDGSTVVETGDDGNALAADEIEQLRAILSAIKAMR